MANEVQMTMDEEIECGTRRPCVECRQFIRALLEFEFTSDDGKGKDEASDDGKGEETGKGKASEEALGGQCVYGPRNKTEGWQPIDAGHLGAMVKALGKANFERWMEATSRNPKHEGKPNWQVWEENAMTMKEKRILVTWVFGNAWSKLCSDSYKHARVSAFLKTGCLLTVSGVNDTSSRWLARHRRVVAAP